MLNRDLQAAAAVQQAIRGAHPQASVEVVGVDLGSLASVRAAAATIRASVDPIDLLINNAGIVSSRHRMSADGFELVFATNHLGPFLLTELLRSHLAARSRVINVASAAHYRGALALERVADPQARYDAVAAYAQSKLANVLHSFALARRFAGTAVTANCLHPGVVATNLLPRWLQLVKPWITPVSFDAERGARTTLYLAQEPTLAACSGKYFDENHVIRAAAPAANQIALQEALWAASACWTGIP
jgi:dehydrogenase/reductase SDR family protein 13